MQFIVSTENDSGSGSLRQALLDAAASGQPGLILIGANVTRIYIQDPLPIISSPIQIITEAERVELIGTHRSQHGFNIRGASQVEISRLVIRDFPGNGIWIESSQHVSIHHCDIGFDASRSHFHPNGKSAIRITDSFHISISHNSLYSSPRQPLTTGTHDRLANEYIEAVSKHPSSKWDVINDLTVWDSSDVTIQNNSFGTNQHRTLIPRFEFKAAVYVFQTDNFEFSHNLTQSSGLGAVFKDSHTILISDCKYYYNAKALAALTIRHWYRSRRAWRHFSLACRYQRVLLELSLLPPCGSFPGGTQYHQARNRFSQHQTVSSPNIS
jgi:hypothetical protein